MEWRLTSFSMTVAASSVEARGGLVAAGGRQAYRLRPGAERFESLDIEGDIGTIHAVAVEPRGRRRIAVATETGLHVFVPRDQAGWTRLSPRGALSEMPVCHLAWAGSDPRSCVLFACRDDLSAFRVDPDAMLAEELDLPPVGAIAADEAGVLAMATFDDRPCVLIGRDAHVLQVRPLDADVDPGNMTFLAVAGDAVAVASTRNGAYVSRSNDAPFEDVPALDASGPLAFEGTSSDAALYGCSMTGDRMKIVRVEGAGSTEIAEIPAAAGLLSLPLALSWDGSRGKLWGTAAHHGLFTLAPATAIGRLS